MQYKSSEEYQINQLSWSLHVAEYSKPKIAKILDHKEILFADPLMVVIIKSNILLLNSNFYNE